MQLVLWCCADGRDVWMGDCCGEGVADVHEDDEFDQHGTQLRPLRRDPLLASRHVALSEQHVWGGAAAAAGTPKRGVAEAAESPLARPLGVTA